MAEGRQLELSEYGTLYRLEDFYWWFVARRQLVNSLLRRFFPTGGRAVIADIGSGTGANERVLSRFGDVILIDFSLEALRFCQARGLTRLAVAGAESIPLQSGTVDLVTALDVLEHVDDDVATLTELYRVLKRDGIILVTVPAYGFLWSEHDEALHHRRRYTAYELKNKMTAAGFDLIRVSYFITILFFPILFMRFWQNLFKTSVRPKTSHIILPSWLNSLLIVLLSFERVICCDVMNLPFGVSVVALGRKQRVAGDLV